MDEKIFALPLELIDYFLLNETEAAELLKHDGHSETDDMDALADALAKRFPKASIVLTIGSDGAIFTNGTKKFRQPSFPVKAVDYDGGRGYLQRLFYRQDPGGLLRRTGHGNGGAGGLHRGYKTRPRRLRSRSGRKSRRRAALELLDKAEKPY